MKTLTVQLPDEEAKLLLLQLDYIEKKYREIGYNTISKLIKCKVKKEIQGLEYLDRISKLLM